MVQFSFKIKEVKKRSPANNASKTILNKKVEGIVIVVNDKYCVHYNNKCYDIEENSFSCKGKKIVYLKDSNNKYTKIIRDVINLCGLPKAYLPFKEKLKVIGDIISINGKVFFKISSACNTASYDEYEEALKLYDKINGNV